MADDQPNQTIYEDQADGSAEASTQGNLNVAKNGITVVPNAKTTNFTGSVTVTDAGDDQADIDIQGLGATFNRYDIGARISSGSGSIESVAIPTLRDLLTPAVSDVVLAVDKGAGNELVQIQLDNLPGGGGGGEVNTASNVGIGTGVFQEKAGVDLEFRSLKDAGNNRITVAVSISGDEIDLDVVPGAILLQTMGGAITVPGQISATGTPSSTTFLRGDGQWAATPGGVISVFGRVGAITALASDYDADQVDVALTPVSYTPTSGFVEGHLAGIDAALGAGGGVVSSWNARTGAVVPLAGDYDFNQITISGPLDAQGEASINILYHQYDDTGANGQFWFTREDASNNYVWKVGATEGAAGVVMTMTPAGNMLTAGTFDGRDVSADGANQDALVTLSGVAAGSTDLGTFTEGIIPASSDDKEALQALETEFRDPSEATRTAMQDSLPLVTETGTFTLSLANHYRRSVKLENPTVASLMQLPAPNDAQFAGIEEGLFCIITVASGTQPAQITALTTNTFRHGSGYSSAVVDAAADSIFLGYSRASAFGNIYGLYRENDVWKFEGPLRTTETDNLTLDLAIQDSSVLELNHCNQLNFATNLAVTVVGRTATIDASGGAGAGTYTALTDTPSSFAGDADKFVKVNAGQTALEHVAGETIADLPVQTGIDGVNDLVAVWDDSASDTVHSSVADLVGAVGVSSFISRTGAVVAVSGDYTATLITNTPAGDIAATDVQAALNELDTDKAPTVHTHTLSQITDSGALAALDTVDTAQIDNDAVTFAKMQNLTSQTFIGRNTSGTGDPEELTAAIARTVLNVEDGAAAPPYGTTDISDDAIIFSKQGNITSQRLVGRTTAGTGDPEEVEIDTLPAQVSPVATDSLLAQRQSDGALIKIDVGDLPSSAGPVESVFGRTAAVIAVAGDYTATQVTNTPAGNIAATTVQGAVNELDAEKAALIHTHTLAAITDSGALAALDTVGSAEIDADSVGPSELAPTAVTPGSFTNADITVDQEGRVTAAASGSASGGVDSFNTRTGAVVSIAGDYTATQVSNAPAGDIAATTVQAAIDELDSEKAPTVHTHTLSQITDSGALAALDTIGTTQIDNDSVTFAKMQNIATASFLGRDTAATGDPEELSAAAAKAVLAYLASEVAFTPAGFIAATDVQAALAEVDAEKPQISTEDELAGQMQIAVVATLPGTPDANTIYFVTT